MRKTLGMSVVLLMLFCSQAFAVPNLLQYQGRLTDAAGTPLNGAQSVVFSIYSVSSAGVAIWTETQSVTVANGLFNVLLGGTTAFPANLFDGTNRFLGIKVGADAEMTPRQQVASVGYAMRSAASEDVAWILVNGDGSIIRQSGGFTVTRQGTGSYRVDHPNINENAVGFVASSFNGIGHGSDACLISCFANNANGFVITTFSPANAPADHDFAIVTPLTGGIVISAPPAATLTTTPVIRVDSHNRPIQ